MAWRFSWYVAPLVIAAGTSFLLAGFAYLNREKRTAPQVVGILLGSGLWAGADAISLVHTSEAVMTAFHDVRLVGSTLLVLSVILFSLEYTNREQWLQARYVAAMAAPFVTTVVLAVTETAVYDHGLIRAGSTVTRSAGLVVTDFQFGPWFWFNAAYSYGLLALSLALYVVELVRTEADTYRKQTLLLAAAQLVPWFMNALYLLEYTAVDLTGAGLAVTGALFYTSLFWLSLLDLIPIARGTVLDHVDHGVLVVDTENTIVDCNDRMVDVIDVPRSVLIGTSTDAVFAEYPEVRRLLAGNRETQGTVSMDRDGITRHYEVDVTPIHSRTDRYIGRTILVQDVTDRIARQRELESRTQQLERQNDRLDEFASIVSHDLRNPLSVANGYLELAREEHDSEELASVDASLDRIEELIDDVLALARESDAADRADPIDLAHTVAEAWQTVDAPDGSIRIECDQTILANRSRARQLLENLLRNAFDHGPADATVTVGDLPDADGFYVEDDGPGIDPDEANRVFEEGYSTTDGGTGLGLSIVRTIADAHGWTVSVTDGRDGGARFEFTGVSSPEVPLEEV